MVSSFLLVVTLVFTGNHKTSKVHTYLYLGVGGVKWLARCHCWTSSVHLQWTYSDHQDNTVQNQAYTTRSGNIGLLIKMFQCCLEMANSSCCLQWDWEDVATCSSLQIVTYRWRNPIICHQGANQGHSNAEPRHGHAVCILQVHNPPPRSVPLTQNLARAKDIAGSDITRWNSDDGFFSQRLIFYHQETFVSMLYRQHIHTLAYFNN